MHEFGQRTGQARLHLDTAFLGTQGFAQCIKHDADAQEEDDAGDTVEKRRNAGDGEFDGP